MKCYKSATTDGKLNFGAKAIIFSISSKLFFNMALYFQTFASTQAISFNDLSNILWHINLTKSQNMIGYRKSNFTYHLRQLRSNGPRQSCFVDGRWPGHREGHKVKVYRFLRPPIYQILLISLWWSSLWYYHWFPLLWWSMYEPVCNDLALKQSLFALVIQPRHGSHVKLWIILIWKNNSIVHH